MIWHMFPEEYIALGIVPETILVSNKIRVPTLLVGRGTERKHVIRSMQLMGLDSSKCCGNNKIGLCDREWD